MTKLNIRPLNVENLVPGSNVSLNLQITAEGNLVGLADITVDTEFEGSVDYDGEGNPVVTFDEIKPGLIVVTASKEGFEDGLLEIQVPEAEPVSESEPGVLKALFGSDDEVPEPAPEETPEEEPPGAPSEEPEPTPVSGPELPVGDDAAVVTFAESLKIGIVLQNLDEGLLNNIISGLSALETFVASAADGAAKTAAREIISLVTPQIPELERKVREAEELNHKVNDISERVTVVEDTLDNITGQTEEDLQNAAEDAVKKAMSKKKLLFL